MSTIDANAWYPVTPDELATLRELAQEACAVNAATMVSEIEGGRTVFRDYLLGIAEAQSDLYDSVRVMDVIGRPGSPLNPEWHSTLSGRVVGWLEVLAAQVVEDYEERVEGAGPREGDEDHEATYEQAYIEFYREGIARAEAALALLEALEPEEVPA